VSDPGGGVSDPAGGGGAVSDLAGGYRPEGEGRSARKRRAIMEAATTLFLRNGYQGTCMDEIAALAAVSKQTVYKNFADKERLFSEIILGAIDAVCEPFHARIRAIQDTNDLEHDLRELARRYIASVMRPQVLQLRRLVIGEAGRLPELARAYYERAPRRTIAMLASCFKHLAERGLLHKHDPLITASHFAFLILGMPLDEATFCGDEERHEPARLERLADAGVRAFVTAYGRTSRAASRCDV